jgi:hypothetical protein
MPDQRAAPRREVELPGRVVFADGSASLECLILDVSDGGVRVRTELSLVLPERVYIWRLDTADIFDCEVRWQLGNQAGLYIVDTCGRQMRKALIGSSAPDHASRVARWLGDP